MNGIRQIALESGSSTIHEMWCKQWAQQTTAEGWTVEVIYNADGSWNNQVYTLLATGETITRTTSNRTAPAGCKTIIEAREDLVPFLGKPTHFVSHPWDMKMCEILEALEQVATRSGWKIEEIFFVFDVFASDYHGCDSWRQKAQGIRFTGDTMMFSIPMIQVCSSWNDPERLKLAWLTYEACGAIVHSQPLIWGLPEHESSSLANTLKNEGPDAVLGIVYAMDLCVDTLVSASSKEKNALLVAISTFIADFGGKLSMELKLAEVCRKCYADVVHSEFERKWEMCKDGGGATVDLQETLDLGHQLARLYALADQSEQAEDIFNRVLERLLVVKKAGSPSTADAIARADRTAAELVKLLRRQGRIQDVERVKKTVSKTGELPVSWDGVTLDFLHKFVDEHSDSVEFLSTDAVVERIVKPTSSSTMLYDPEPKGRAVVEMAHSKNRSTPSFFIRHAWRQTFSVETVEYRGGLVQALLHCVPRAEHGTTAFWCDIFCVNQHLRSPYGGLLAFAFEPLRNAMLDCDHLKVFMETWDDPAPLGRIWCLDELRNAILLGKRVEVIMPPQAASSFRGLAEKNPEGTKKDIERVVQTIDIERASSTFRADREFVIGQVRSTIGTRALNLFCRQIIRDALLKYAGLQEEPLATGGAALSGEWGGIFAELLDQERGVGVPQRIELKRAVAMMQLRLSSPGSALHNEGSAHLQEAGDMAQRYYGRQSEVFSDIMRLIS